MLAARHHVQPPARTETQNEATHRKPTPGPKHGNLSQPIHEADHANAFFTQLLTHSRIYSETQLLRWWSADTTAHRYKTIRPNGGHGVWRDGDRETGFFLHFDLRTRYRPTRDQELEHYANLRSSGNPSYPLLLVFQNPANERAFHNHHTIYSTLVGTVATATLTDHPADAVWKPVGEAERCRISDLPSDHGSAGLLNPGQPIPDDDPLRASVATGHS